MRRSPAQKAALLLAMVVAATVQLTVALVAPFFAVYATETLGATVAEAGLTIAALPISSMFVSPLVPYCFRCCGGRLPVLGFGIVGLAFTTWAFGQCTSLSHFLLCRIGQGAAGAFMSIAKDAILIQNSEDLGTDLGMIEICTAAVYSFGPAIGGFLYQACGLEATFNVIAFLQISNLALLPVVRGPLLQQQRELDEKQEQRRRAGALVQGAKPDPASVAFEHLVAKSGLVQFCGWLNAVIFASFGFYDCMLAPHLRATLDFGALSTGLTFLVPAVVYGLFSFIVGPQVGRRGCRSLLTMGFFVWGLAYITFGPPPALTDAPHPRSWVWLCLIAMNVMYGPGVSSAVIPVVPLIKAVSEQIVARHPEWSSEVATAMDDATAAWFGLTMGLGEGLGPMLGALGMAHLPQTYEMGCDTEPCMSGWSWTSTTSGLVLIAQAVAVWFVVPPDAGKLAKHHQPQPAASASVELSGAGLEVTPLHPQNGDVSRWADCGNTGYNTVCTTDV